MYYGVIKTTDIANGPGVRVSLFVSGCTHHCKDCFNPETWNFSYGQPFTEETIAKIETALEPDYIAGLTVLGGEPMEPDNQRALLPLYKRVKQRFPQKNIWAYSGYLLEEELQSIEKAGTLLEKTAHLPKLPEGAAPYRSAVCEVTEEVLSLLDVLVDGKFLTEQKDLTLRFRGSRNQRLIDLNKTRTHNRIVLWEETNNQS